MRQWIKALCIIVSLSITSCCTAAAEQSPPLPDTYGSEVILVDDEQTVFEAEADTDITESGIESDTQGAARIASLAPLPEEFTNLNVEICLKMPFKPAHKYVCMQNPPDFTWPPISNAVSYDLKICTDEALKNTAYSKDGLTNNYYNFRETFTPGTYYWAVRYTKKVAGVKHTSNWSVARRFRIDPDASEFILPTGAADIVTKIPSSHPRIWVTQDTMDEFRKTMSEGGRAEVLERMLSQLKTYMQQEPLAEPTDTTQAAVSAASTKGFQCQLGALCYLITGDTEMADYAVKTMLELAAWDSSETKPAPTSFAGQDQAYYEILLRLSMAYDWMYNYMTDAQRSTVRNVLMTRFNVRLQKDLDTLRSNPYDSHIWSYSGYYCTACMALLYEEPSVESYLKQMLELYIPNLPPMSEGDGGWSKGTAYWTYAFNRDKWFMDVLKVGGYADLYKKAWAQNETYWAMYMMPANSYGSFGDESNMVKPGDTYIMGLSKLGKFAENPIAYWARNKVGNTTSLTPSTFDLLLLGDTVYEDGEAPLNLPNSYTFVDQGMTAMHSSILSDDRISMYFRSGKYGSYNHMHADQNSFMIEAFGEKLAIKSGYYDSYHSTHDSNFTRTTFAHNSITYDGGIGQQDDNIDANGKTEMFLTHHDFDAVVGNGTRAYNYTQNGVTRGLNKFVRSMIYIRPGIYISVDDLKGRSNTTPSFEWALNAPYNTMTLSGTQSASVVNGKAELDVNLAYPQNMTNTGIMQNYDNLETPAVSYPPNSRYINADKQDRVYFKTANTTETKIVATMQVHKSDEAAQNITTEYGEGYLIITAEDGTKAIVNTGSNTAAVNANNISFKGTAVVYNDKSIMLVGGTELKAGGKTIVSADREVSVVVGKNQLSISSDDDMNISIGLDSAYTADISAADITDSKGRSLSADIGVTSSVTGNILKLSAQKGHYMLLTSEDAVVNNQALIPSNLRAVNNKATQTSLMYWDNVEKAASYDIMIDGVITENVTSPYQVSLSDKEYAEVRVRSHSPITVSDWSEPVYAERYREAAVTRLKLEMTDANGQKTDVLQEGGKIWATLNCYNGNRDNLILFLAEYDQSGGLLNEISVPAVSEKFSQISTSAIDITSTLNTYKAFAVNPYDMRPYLTSATAGLGAEGTLLRTINVDGTSIEEFSNDVKEYTVMLEADGQIPVVKGVPQDGSTYVTTKYNVNDSEATAVVYAESKSGETDEFTVNFVLPQGGATEVTPLVSDFKSLLYGKNYTEYCEYAGVTPDPDAASTKRVWATYKVLNFEIGGDLCGENSQRKITDIDKSMGTENCYFIGSGASLYQTGSSAPWIVAAFTGQKISETINGKTVLYDFSSYPSVPWFSFKVNRDCEVMILSATEPRFCKEDGRWIYTKLSSDPYKAVRNGAENISAFRNLYTKPYKAGDTVELYNDLGGLNSVGIPYITIVRF